MRPNAGKALLLFLVFSAVAVLVSQWLGLVWRNTPAVILVSLALTWLLAKRFPVEWKRFAVPKSAWLLALLALAMAAYPLLTITQFYAPSADALHTITVRVLAEKIPPTYAPYSDFPFDYQFGFHLLARLFVDALPFVPDYLILWALGALFAGAQVIVFFWLGKALLKSEKAGLWCALLFLGTRIAFQNMYFGLYPMIFGSALFFLAIALFLERSPLWAVFFPAVFVVHAGSAFNMLVFFALLLIFFRDRLKPFARLAWLALLALPSFAIVYPPFFANPFLKPTGQVLPELLGALSRFPLWAGLIPTLMLVLAVALTWKRGSMSREKAFSAALLICSTALFAYFAYNQGQLFGKVVELISVSLILFASATLAEKKVSFLESRFFRVLVVALCLTAFLSSGYLNSLRAGDKLTAEEAQFAFVFREFDPKPEKTVFLAEHGGKMAEYSNKAPYDAMQDYFLPYSPTQILDCNSYGILLARHSEQERILSEGCAECVYGLGARYVVVDSNFTGIRLDARSVLAKGSFALYDLGENQ